MITDKELKRMHTLARKFVRNEEYEALHEAARLVMAAKKADQERLISWWRKGTRSVSKKEYDENASMRILRLQIKQFS